MFIETICIYKGHILNIEAHTTRMQSTAEHFNFAAPTIPDLTELIPRKMDNKKVRCTITYGSEISNIQFIEYTQRRITSLKIVESEIDYSYKFSDRKLLNDLLLQKEECDEILIVKDNCITDTTFSNVIFKNSDGLFTPNTYLLNGTKRQHLINSGIIKEKRITTNDLHLYDYVFLINAMLDIGEIKIDTQNIFYI